MKMIGRSIGGEPEKNRSHILHWALGLCSYRSSHLYLFCFEPRGVFPRAKITITAFRTDGGAIRVEDIKIEAGCPLLFDASTLGHGTSLLVSDVLPKRLVLSGGVFLLQTYCSGKCHVLIFFL